MFFDFNNISSEKTHIRILNCRVHIYTGVDKVTGKTTRIYGETEDEIPANNIQNSLDNMNKTLNNVAAKYL